MNTTTFLSLSVLGFALSTQATSAQAQRQLTSAESAAAFGAREHIRDASISPDGNSIALVVPGPAQSTIVETLDMRTGSARQVNYANGDPMTLTSCAWASNLRLVCNLYGVSDQNYGQWLPYRRMIAMNADGSNPLPLGATERLQQYASLSDGYVIDWRDGMTDSILIARNYVPGKGVGLSGATGMAEGLGVDLLDTRTGKVSHVESAHPRAEQYIADGQGRIRIMATDEAFRAGYQSRGVTTYVYRLAGSDDWKPFSTYSSVTYEGFRPIAVDGVSNQAYVVKKLNGRDALYRVALDGSMREELAFAHPKVDVSSIVRLGRSGRIVGASFEVERPDVHYFDDRYAKLVQRIGRLMPGKPLISIVDSSADEKKHLIFAGSDTDPGQYYVFDTTTLALNPIGKERPELTDVALGTVTAITYKAADGTEIPGYLTLPPGGGKNLPAIVMPHGGPASRDGWGFDWLAQFFVNRGYAVLQPNYRGSTGYGQQWFQDNGFRSWKVAIGDVNDAGRWMVQQGIADSKKLAIVGWSYGGYAALQSSVLDPELFKAIVAIAPVTDLGMLRGQYPASRLARDYIGEGPQIREGSPLQHIEAFRAPVLMFHGDKDINVEVAESRAMDRALRKAGKSSELVIYPRIDHQLMDSKVRTDMLTRADAFLSKALR